MPPKRRHSAHPTVLLNQTKSYKSLKIFSLIKIFIMKLYKIGHCGLPDISAKPFSKNLAQTFIVEDLSLINEISVYTGDVSNKDYSNLKLNLFRFKSSTPDSDNSFDTDFECIAVSTKVAYESKLFKSLTFSFENILLLSGSYCFSFSWTGDSNIKNIPCDISSMAGLAVNKFPKNEYKKGDTITLERIPPESLFCEIELSILPRTGEIFKGGSNITYSPNGIYGLGITIPSEDASKQPRLVIFDANGIKWKSEIQYRDTKIGDIFDSYAHFYKDCLLLHSGVTGNKSNDWLWHNRHPSAGNWVNPAVALYLDNDGKLNLLDSGGKVVWSSNG